MTTVGVIIRTLDESALIGRCLETLQHQRGGFDLDVLVVDSGSTDGTVEIARAHGARVHEIPPAEFDYSRALNVGIERLSGELVISLSAHAIPLDDRWLERMTAPFAEPRVAGVSCRQVPWPDAPWHEVHRLARAFGDARRVFDSVHGAGLLFSNAASCFRRSVWEREPFTLPAAEDLEWAERVTAAGWSVVYEPSAAVYHSHDESARHWAQRLIDVNRVATADEPRTRRRTLREAAGLLARESRAILRSHGPVGRKATHLAALAHMLVFYMLDFSRSGSIAERRRQDAPAVS